MHNGTIFSQIVQRPILMAENHYRVLPVDREHARSHWICHRKARSGPQPITAAEGMPSGPWRVLGLKLAGWRAMASTSKTAPHKAGLFLFCSFVGSLTVPGIMEQVRY